MNTRLKSITALLIAILLSSTSGLLIKMSGWDAMALNGARSIIAFGLIWIYLRRPNFTWSRAQVGGAVFYALMIITFVQATKWTTAANAVFLQFSAPIWVALFSIWLLGERPSRSDWLTIIAVACGMLLFFGGELTRTGYWGNLVAIFSGICMALMLIALRMQKDGSPTETVLLGNGIAALIGLPFILWGDQPVNAREISIILFLGIFQLGIPFLIITLVIKHLSAIQTVLIESLAPVLLALWVYLFLGEKPGPAAMAGAAIVTTAVLARTINAARKERRTMNVQQTP